jgi:hypothetical protein
MARQPGAHPGELRRVHGLHLHDGDPHVAVVMEQFGADRLGELVGGVLRAAVGGLQRDRPVAEGGPDLHDRATVAALHAAQRRHRAAHWFERNRSATGPAALYTEEYDVHQQQRGNLPQAFVHAVILECAVTLSRDVRLGGQAEVNL